MDIRQQYNQFSDKFSQSQTHLEENKVNRELMRQFIGNNLSNKIILDIGCGDGLDLDYYQSLGAKIYGIDASQNLTEIAQTRLPNANLTVGFAENMPYKNEYFDCVFSKYAIMTSSNLRPIFAEVHRILKTGGDFIYLCSHPFRQFLEKKRLDANYFQQEVVESIIFSTKIPLQEPSHTFNEYFNKDFLNKFIVADFIEAFDPAAEKINNAVYPGFFIVKAVKK